ncbi:hypothetical protein [Capnocytophaga gingivalis]|jgi:hypothetical protein|uniref:hypothetical protein n=1 Tax=Capnocytophaga gingivalis TaxID=1017 RepID=UPI00403DEFCA
MKMEMQLNRIIVLFFFYTSVLMSQIVSEKEENLKFSQIDFFDKKYEKAIYSLIIDESNISDHPIMSYIDCFNEGYFTIHFIPKENDLKIYWRKMFYAKGDFENIDLDSDSKKIYKLLKDKFNEYFIFSCQIKKEYLVNKDNCTEESISIKKKAKCCIYMYDPTYKKWKLIDIIYAKILPPYYNNLFFKRYTK